MKEREELYQELVEARDLGYLDDFSFYGNKFITLNVNLLYEDKAGIVAQHLERKYGYTLQQGRPGHWIFERVIGY